MKYLKLFFVFGLYITIVFGQEEPIKEKFIPISEAFWPDNASKYKTYDNICWAYCVYNVVGCYKGFKNGEKEKTFSDIMIAGSKDYDLSNSFNETKPGRPKNVVQLLQSYGVGTDYDKRSLDYENLDVNTLDIKKAINTKRLIVAALQKISDNTKCHGVVIQGYDDDDPDYGPKIVKVFDNFLWINPSNRGTNPVQYESFKKNTSRDYQWVESIPVSKNLAMSCSPKINLAKTIAPEKTDNCGTDGSWCEDCFTMDNVINGSNAGGDYDILGPSGAFFSRKDKLGLDGANQKPYGIFVSNYQTRLFMLNIPTGDVTVDGNFVLSIDCIIATKNGTLESFTNTNGEYFRAEIYVDDKFQAPLLNCKYNNLNTSNDELTSNFSRISTFIWLTTTSKNIKIVITSGNLITSSERAVVVIKSFDLSKSSGTPISTGSGTGTGVTTGVNGKNEHVFVEGNKVIFPAIVINLTHPVTPDNPYQDNPCLIGTPTLHSNICSVCLFTVEGSVHNNDYIQFKLNWGDETESDWVDHQDVTFNHEYKNANTYTVTGYYRTKPNIFGILGWTDPVKLTTYSVTIVPPLKTAAPPSIDILRRKVSILENNKRFFPEISNLRLAPPLVCLNSNDQNSGCTEMSAYSNSITGKVKIEWGDGLSNIINIHLSEYLNIWDRYEHYYPGPGEYQIKVYYETKNLTKLDCSPVVYKECFKWEQQTKNNVLIGNRPAPLPTLKLVKIPGKNLLITPTEITQLEYKSVTGLYPFEFGFNNTRDYCPTENVSYYDAILYCNYRSLIDGLQPVYSYDQPQSTDFNSKGLYCSILRNLTPDIKKNGYRLPTKDEWNYAYLAGTSPTANNGYYWQVGDDPQKYAWYGGVFNKTQLVSKKFSNAWGLYDMAGNVSEWTTSEAPESDFASTRGGNFSSGLNQITYEQFVEKRYPKSSYSHNQGFRVVRKAPDITPILNLLLND